MFSGLSCTIALLTSEAGNAKLTSGMFGTSGLLA
jgi:hypothetical protein